MYVIMTKGTEYSSSQIWRTRGTWDEIEAEMKQGYSDGKVITDFVYWKKIDKYFLVMTKQKGQGQKWYKTKDEE